MKIDSNIFKFLLLKIARRAFIVCLVVFVLVTGLGAIFLFEIYSRLQIEETVPVVVLKNYFNEEAYRKMLDSRRSDEDRFDRAGGKIYPDPFSESARHILP